MKISTLIRTAGRMLSRRGLRRSAVDDLIVERVDDPLGTMCLVRVIGVVDERCVRRVIKPWRDVAPPQAVHLDLHDAFIVDDGAMTALEQAIDRLEGRRVGIRVVGVDPHHPALTH